MQEKLAEVAAGAVFQSGLTLGDGMRLPGGSLYNAVHAGPCFATAFWGGAHFYTLNMRAAAAAAGDEA